MFRAVRSERDTWCAIRLYRLFAHRDFEEQGSASSHPRDAKCRRRPGFGPTILPRCSGPSDQRGTRGARLGSIASSRIATLKSKDQPLLPSTRREVPKASRIWAHNIAEMFRVVRSERDTWCTIRLYRLFAHRDFEEQGSASSHPRDAKCRRRPGVGPTILPRCSGPSDQRGTRGARLGSIASSRIATLKTRSSLLPSTRREVPKASGTGPTILPRCSGPSDQRGTRGARLGSIASSRIATLKNKDQPPPSCETRSAESAFEDKRRVTARGHSGK
jgi:hypothetical protein